MYPGLDCRERVVVASREFLCLVRTVFLWVFLSRGEIQTTGERAPS